MNDEKNINEMCKLSQKRKKQRDNPFTQLFASNNGKGRIVQDDAEFVFQEQKTMLSSIDIADSFEGENIKKNKENNSMMNYLVDMNVDATFEKVKMTFQEIGRKQENTKNGERQAKKFTKKQQLLEDAETLAREQSLNSVDKFLDKKFGMMGAGDIFINGESTGLPKKPSAGGKPIIKINKTKHEDEHKSKNICLSKHNILGASIFSDLIPNKQQSSYKPTNMQPASPFSIENVSTMSKPQCLMTKDKSFNTQQTNKNFILNQQSKKYPNTDYTTDALIKQRIATISPEMKHRQSFTKKYCFLPNQKPVKLSPFENMNVFSNQIESPEFSLENNSPKKDVIMGIGRNKAETLPSKMMIEQVVLKSSPANFDKLMDMFVDPSVEHPCNNKVPYLKNTYYENTRDTCHEYIHENKSRINMQPNAIPEVYNYNTLNAHHSPPLLPVDVRSYNNTPPYMAKNSAILEHAISKPTVPVGCFTIKKDSSLILQKTPHLKLSVKLSKYNPLSNDQKIAIGNITANDTGMRFRFFRTVSSVADILNVQRPSIESLFHMRQLYAVYSQYSGFLSTPVHILNTLKHIPLQYYQMYQTYVLPLESSSVYASLKFRNYNKDILSKERLVTIMCSGVYDDIFFLFEHLDSSEVPPGLINELFNVFFLTSDILFVKFGFSTTYLDNIITRITAKPYRNLLENMNRSMLYQFHWVVVKAIINFEKNKKSKQILSDEIVNHIFELILKRNQLKHFYDIKALEDSIKTSYVKPDITFLENEILAIKFLCTPSICIRIDDRIMSVMLSITHIDPMLVLAASANLVTEPQDAQIILQKIENALRRCITENFMTLSSKILLKDGKQLENIFSTFLPFMFLSSTEINMMLTIIKDYIRHLEMKKVYFYKKDSSNIVTIYNYLERMINQKDPRHERC